MELLPIGMLAAVLVWWLWVDYHNRRIRKEWRDHPIEVDQDFAAQAERNRRLNELAQRIRELEAEVAALKPPAA